MAANEEQIKHLLNKAPDNDLEDKHPVAPSPHTVADDSESDELKPYILSFGIPGPSELNNYALFYRDAENKPAGTVGSFSMALTTLRSLIEDGELTVNANFGDMDFDDDADPSAPLSSSEDTQVEFLGALVSKLPTFPNIQKLTLNLREIHPSKAFFDLLKHLAALKGSTLTHLNLNITFKNPDPAKLFAINYSLSQTSIVINRQATTIGLDTLSSETHGQYILEGKPVLNNGNDKYESLFETEPYTDEQRNAVIVLQEEFREKLWRDGGYESNVISDSAPGQSKKNDDNGNGSKQPEVKSTDLQDKPSDKTSFFSPQYLLPSSVFVSLVAGSLIPVLNEFVYGDESSFHHLDQDIFLIVNLGVLAAALLATAWTFKALKNDKHQFKEDAIREYKETGSMPDPVRNANRRINNLVWSLGFVAASSFCLLGAFVWAVSTPDFASLDEAPGKTLGSLYATLGISAAVAGLTATITAYGITTPKLSKGHS